MQTSAAITMGRRAQNSDNSIFARLQTLTSGAIYPAPPNRTPMTRHTTRRTGEIMPWSELHPGRMRGSRMATSQLAVSTMFSSHKLVLFIGAWCVMCSYSFPVVPAQCFRAKGCSPQPGSLPLTRVTPTSRALQLKEKGTLRLTIISSAYGAERRACVVTEACGMGWRGWESNVRAQGSHGIMDFGATFCTRNALTRASQSRASQDASALDTSEEDICVSEGAVRGLRVARSLAAKPGSASGFYNSKRRVGRDFVVLSVAQWLANNTSSRQSNWTRPARVLDAMCASGMQGLRVAVESPLLAKAISSERHDPPALEVVLNDADSATADLAEENAQQVDRTTVNVTRRVAQALMHEESFDICVLDPFGSTVPFLDAALARVELPRILLLSWKADFETDFRPRQCQAPHLGRLEVCATDLGALYGSRPAVTRRHYSCHLQEKRPGCYRERGVRLLLAAVAQAAGRQGRGVECVVSVSTEHLVLASLRVIRGARGADATAGQLKMVRICRECSASAVSPDAPQCGCEPTDGAGADACEEGPLWVGALCDPDHVRQMVQIANSTEGSALIPKQTRALLSTLNEEALVKGMFYRRPQGVAKGVRTPKLTEVMEELWARGHASARTHFDTFALKTDASALEFDQAVNAVATRAE